MTDASRVIKQESKRLAAKLLKEYRQKIKREKKESQSK